MLDFVRSNNSARKASKPLPIGSDIALPAASFLRSVAFGKVNKVLTLPYVDYHEAMIESEFTSFRRERCVCWVSDPTTLRMDNRGIVVGDLVCFDELPDDPSEWFTIRLAYHHTITLDRPVLFPNNKTALNFTVFRK